LGKFPTTLYWENVLQHLIGEIKRIKRVN